MRVAKLKFGGDEVVITSGVTTIGRTSENDISFADDSNVSRSHAEIEFRDGEYWLIDLNSSNGTTVDGVPVDGEVRIRDGARIVFGGSSEAEFSIEGPATDGADRSDKAVPGAETGPEPLGIGQAGDAVGSLGRQAGSEAEYAASNAIRGAVADAASGTPSASTAAASSGTSLGSTVIVAGAVVGLAVVAAVAAGAVYLTRGSSCDARVSIVRPEPGDTIIAPVEIEVRVENAECVQRAVYTIDGEEVALAEGPDFAASSRSSLSRAAITH